MNSNIKFITIDGRGEHETFKDCVTSTLKTIKADEGIHVIKDFEPFPLYKMMQSKGFSKEVNKISDEEYHAYFYKESLENIEMTNHLEIKDEKIKYLIDIKLRFLKGKLTVEDARKELEEINFSLTAQEFAVAEQYMEKFGVDDDSLTANIEDLVAIFNGFIIVDEIDLEKGHPIHTYLEEVKAIRSLLSVISDEINNNFIKNKWLEIYGKLSEINIHFSRKQNQIYPALESKGFDKPSSVMWTLENDIKNEIKRLNDLLLTDNIEEFMNSQSDLVEMVEDMMIKEEEILYPTTLDMLEEEDFIIMRKGDDEIGYCLIEEPPKYKDKEKSSELLKDLSKLLSKHGILEDKSESSILDVSQGKLTLSQINLVFKHLSVDLSFVDENDLVKFYSDTKHRVFPRSPGVIGREVKNCHPRESVYMVEEIIRAFKAGEQDEAEFWLELDGKFLYIIYTAVRDEKGEYKGILEMMQDVTRIRALEGTQRLLSWTNDEKVEEKKEVIKTNEYGITSETVVGPLVKKYPYLKEVLLSLSPKYSKLKNPVLFKTMSAIATLEMISKRGNLEVEFIIDKLVQAIKKD